MKITRENQLILKRLQDKKAHYDVQSWQKDEVKRKRTLANICEYPLVMKDPYAQPDFIIKRRNKSSNTAGGFYKKKGFANPMQAAHYAANQIVKKQTLFNGNHDLGNGVYNVEILISQGDDLVISAQHTELPDSFIIEIDSSKVNHLITEFQHDFYTMANHLKIMNKRMVLLNPKFLKPNEP